MINDLFSLILRVGFKISSYIRTRDAHSQALVGNGTKLGAHGRVFNIAKNKTCIRLGNHNFINGEVLTFAHGGKIETGDWFYLGEGSKIWSSSEGGVKIGDRVLVSMSVQIHDTNSHPLDPQKRFEQTQAIIRSGHPSKDLNIKAAPIFIGDDVWIGFGATVFKGVTIGSRAIIGARAIVVSDVPEDGYVPSPTERCGAIQ